MHQAQGLFTYNKTAFHYLPQNIAFDDFKSGNFADTNGMSMILMDSATHHVLDIMRKRGDNGLRHYFEQYSYTARAAVKTITVDLFSPYRQMIHDLVSTCPNHRRSVPRYHTSLSSVEQDAYPNYESLWCWVTGISATKAFLEAIIKR